MAPSDDASAGHLSAERQAAICVRGLSKTYRSQARTEHALREVNLEVKAGEMVAILGKSGSGKTTLLNVLGGLDSDYTGTVQVGGFQLEQLDANQLANYRKKHIGFVFQHFVLRPDLNCLDNVMLPAVIAGDDEDAAQIRAVRLLMAVGLGRLLLEDPTKMSGGQRQRIAIARALLSKPSLLLCDEPTGALDEQTGEQIMDLLCGLQEQIGFAAVIVSHEQAVAARTDRLVFLKQGRVEDEANASPAGLCRNTADNKTALPSEAEARKLLEAARVKQRHLRRKRRPRLFFAIGLKTVAVVAGLIAMVRFTSSTSTLRWLGIFGSMAAASLLVRWANHLQRQPLGEARSKAEEVEGKEAGESTTIADEEETAQAITPVPAQSEKGE